MLRGTKVLIVEDEALIGEELRRRLTHMGAEIEGPIANGDVAVQTAADTCPDLVLLDIRLADGTDGVETARRIRQEADIPIVFLTAHSDDQTIAQAVSTGPFGYLIKPVSDALLRAAIPVVLERHRTERASRSISAAREDALRDAALRDPLTGLWNRRAILDILDQELSRANREGRALTVCMIDVDRFKCLNDAYGHVVGDRVLRTVAERMAGSIRPYDAIGRIGGDEFLLISSERGSKNANALACRLKRVVAEPRLQVGELSIVVSISVGICEGSMASASAVALVEAADRSLYEDKRRHQSDAIGVGPANEGLIRRIEGEFAEMSGLSLTPAQARRLWNIDEDECRTVLDTLVERRFLVRTITGQFIRR